MIDPKHPTLSVKSQCQLVSISRSCFYGGRQGESALNLTLMRQIDEQFMETPFYGSRQMARHLKRQGNEVGRKRVRRLMARMGLQAIYQKPKTTVRHPEHRTYPICCGDWSSTGPIRSGARISPTSRCAADSCISSPSWTGSAARSWPGGLAIRWMSSSVSQPWRKR